MAGLEKSRCHEGVRKKKRARQSSAKALEVAMGGAAHGASVLRWW